MRHLEGDFHGLPEELGERWTQPMDQDMKSSSYKVCRRQRKGREEMSLSSLYTPRSEYQRNKKNCLIWKSVLAKNKNWQEIKNGLTIRGGSPPR